MAVEYNEERTKARSGRWGVWVELDEETGLPKLPEGMYFHVGKDHGGVLMSIRAKRWYGYVTLVGRTTDISLSEEGLLTLSLDLAVSYTDSFEYRRWVKKQQAKKAQLDASKWMGSYNGRKKLGE